VAPDEPFRTVKVDSVDDLQNQAVMQKRCWRDLNWAPFRVKDNKWIDTVNRAMDGIENRQVVVAKETDTSELSDMRNCLMQYLTHRQIKNSQPYTILSGQVYYEDGTYFFLHTGFKNYLRIAKVAIGRLNLREWLISQGCSEGEVTWTTGTGKKKSLPCWKKPETEELRQMGTFYDDIYEGDEDILQKSKISSEGEEDTDGVRF
jgi:hypothetical protein